MIRAYTADDLDDALDAWYEASIIAHSFLPDEFFVAERVELAERLLPAAETYVFEVDGRLVGFVSLAPGHVDAAVLHQTRRLTAVWPAASRTQCRAPALLPVQGCPFVMRNHRQDARGGGWSCRDGGHNRFCRRVRTATAAGDYRRNIPTSTGLPVSGCNPVSCIRLL